MKSIVLDYAMRSLREPIEQFIETGLYQHYDASEEEDLPVKKTGSFGSDGAVPGVSVKSICRLVAKELKRPFITCTEIWAYSNWDAKLRKTPPRWCRGYITVPAQKKLLSHYLPLTLLPPETARVTGRTVIAVQIRNQAFFEAYRERLLTDPHMRAARGLDT